MGIVTGLLFHSGYFQRPFGNHIKAELSICFISA